MCNFLQTVNKLDMIVTNTFSALEVALPRYINAYTLLTYL